MRKLMTTTTDSTTLRQYFDKLEKKEDFLPLLKKFIHRSIEEQYLLDDNNDNSSISYRKFYEKFVDSVFTANAENVFTYCQSPIERMFLNSFMLLFLKNRMPCLFVTHPHKDTELDINNYRDHYKDMDDFIDSYRRVTNDNNLVHFEERLTEKQRKGEFTEEQIQDILSYCFIRKTFEFNSYHITPQAAFPNLRIDNKSIRVDFYIWVPNDPSVKIVVECDGFEFHKTKSSFINDKQRDRLFQLNGYRVIRYSGSEIYNDPVEVSSNLFDLINTLDNDTENRRIT